LLCAKLLLPSISQICQYYVHIFVVLVVILNVPFFTAFGRFVHSLSINVCVLWNNAVFCAIDNTHITVLFNYCLQYYAYM